MENPSTLSQNSMLLNSTQNCQYSDLTLASDAILKKLQLLQIEKAKLEEAIRVQKIKEQHSNQQEKQNQSLSQNMRHIDSYLSPKSQLNQKKINQQIQKSPNLVTVTSREISQPLIQKSSNTRNFQQNHSQSKSHQNSSAQLKSAASSINQCNKPHSNKPQQKNSVKSHIPSMAPQLYGKFKENYKNYIGIQSNRAGSTGSSMQNLQAKIIESSLCNQLTKSHLNTNIQDEMITQRNSQVQESNAQNLSKQFSSNQSSTNRIPNIQKQKSRIVNHSLNPSNNSKHNKQSFDSQQVSKASRENRDGKKMQLEGIKSKIKRLKLQYFTSLLEHYKCKYCSKQQQKYVSKIQRFSEVLKRKKQKQYQELCIKLKETDSLKFLQSNDNQAPNQYQSQSVLDQLTNFDYKQTQKDHPFQYQEARPYPQNYTTGNTTPLSSVKQDNEQFVINSQSFVTPTQSDYNCQSLIRFRGNLNHHPEFTNDDLNGKAENLETALNRDQQNKIIFFENETFSTNDIDKLSQNQKYSSFAQSNIQISSSNQTAQQIQELKSCSDKLDILLKQNLSSHLTQQKTSIKPSEDLKPTQQKKQISAAYSQQTSSKKIAVFSKLRQTTNNLQKQKNYNEISQIAFKIQEDGQKRTNIHLYEKEVAKKTIDKQYQTLQKFERDSKSRKSIKPNKKIINNDNALSQERARNPKIQINGIMNFNLSRQQDLGATLSNLTQKKNRKSFQSALQSDKKIVKRDIDKATFSVQKQLNNKLGSSNNDIWQTVSNYEDLNFGTLTQNNFGRNLISQFQTIEQQKYLTQDASPAEVQQKSQNKSHNTRNRPPSCFMQQNQNIDLHVQSKERLIFSTCKPNARRINDKETLHITQQNQIDDIYESQNINKQSCLNFDTASANSKNQLSYLSPGRSQYSNNKNSQALQNCSMQMSTFSGNTNLRKSQASFQAKEYKEKQGFLVKKSTKVLTVPQDFNFNTNKRAQDRSLSKNNRNQSIESRGESNFDKVYQKQKDKKVQQMPELLSFGPERMNYYDEIFIQNLEQNPYDSLEEQKQEFSLLDKLIKEYDLEDVFKNSRYEHEQYSSTSLKQSLNFEETFNNKLSTIKIEDCYLPQQ
eukprot:403345819